MKATTKNLILENAVNLFWQNGYHGTSILDIAQACMIQKSSFYAHFPSKESLLINIIDDCHHKVKSEFKTSGMNDENTALFEKMPPAKQLKFIASNDKQLAAIFFISTETEGVIPSIGRPLKSLFNDINKILTSNSGNKDSMLEKRIELGRFIGACLLSRVYRDPSLIDEICPHL